MSPTAHCGHIMVGLSKKNNEFSYQYIKNKNAIIYIYQTIIKRIL